MNILSSSNHSQPTFQPNLRFSSDSVSIDLLLKFFENSVFRNRYDITYIQKPLKPELEIPPGISFKSNVVRFEPFRINLHIHLKIFPWIPFKLNVVKLESVSTALLLKFFENSSVDSVCRFNFHSSL